MKQYDRALWAMIAIFVWTFVWMSMGYFCGFQDAVEVSGQPWSKRGQTWMSQWKPSSDKKINSTPPEECVAVSMWELADGSFWPAPETKNRIWTYVTNTRGESRNIEDCEYVEWWLLRAGGKQ